MMVSLTFTGPQPPDQQGTMTDSAPSLSQLTAEWDDDERMDFLFSDFKSNRDVDPMDWDTKMDFWGALVVGSCRRRGTVSCSLQQLQETFRRNGRSPLGLETVLRVLNRWVAWWWLTSVSKSLSVYHQSTNQ